MAKYHKLGSMIERRDKETKEPILDKDEKKTYYFKVGKGVKITIDGVALKEGDYINVKRPYDYDYRQHYINNVTTEEEYEAKKSQYEGDGEKSYIAFDLEFISDKK